MGSSNNFSYVFPQNVRYKCYGGKREACSTLMPKSMIRVWAQDIQDGEVFLLPQYHPNLSILALRGLHCEGRQEDGSSDDRHKSPCKV